MNDSTLTSPEHIRAFLDGVGSTNISVERTGCYAFVARTLKQTNYFSVRKKEKASVREYLLSLTGYSRAQLNRLIKQYHEHGWIGKREVVRHTFPCRYTREDILLLAKTDECHQTLSGAMTKKLFERAYVIFKDTAYERLINISVAHIYNLRKSKCYQQRRQHFEKTKSTSIKIGERRKPNPEGRPGYIRIDTVHQGDKDKKKGVYHINAVDETTQFEVICSVEKISENFLIPILEDLLDSFPFKILNFHSDNGSEYINARVAELLNKLNSEFTKSRARQSSDNGLVESKNGSVVRKYFGYTHISQKYAPLMNKFNAEYLTPYINFHRPCYFPEIKIDKKGKEKKIYPYKAMMTPYEKLKSLPNAQSFLKEGISFDEMDKKAMSMTDLEAAEEVNKKRKKMFQTIFSGEKETIG
jgi:transposase InsO family protein